MDEFCFQMGPMGDLLDQSGLLAMFHGQVVPPALLRNNLWPGEVTSYILWPRDATDRNPVMGQGAALGSAIVPGQVRSQAVLPSLMVPLARLYV